jgi:hypothetical protein
VDGNAEWKLTYEDLVGLEDRLPLKVSRLTETVYALACSPARAS